MNLLPRIIKECKCASHCKSYEIGSFTSPESVLSDYVTYSYFCTRCYKRGVLELTRKWKNA